MIYEFKNKEELITRYNEKLDYNGKYEFVRELIDNINNMNKRFNLYRNMILLENDNSSKAVILKTSLYAKDALDLTKPFDGNKKSEYITPVMLESIDRDIVTLNNEMNYTNNELVELYNKFLELVYKSIHYFSKILSISHVFAVSLFGTAAGCLYDYEKKPIIKSPECLGHMFYSACEEEQKKIENNYKKLLSNIDESFEEEWNKIKKYMPCKLN